MEFDDRWAHRGNQVNTNNEYEQTGYPMGLRVMSTAHSYGVSFNSDGLLGEIILEAKNIPKAANTPTMATTITAVQFTSYISVKYTSY